MPLGTSSALDIGYQPGVATRGELSILVPADILAAIRANLSLTVVETAQTLGVERPTVYAWLAGRAEPQERNRERLLRVLQVARTWSRLSSRPVGLAVRRPNDSGTSVLDLLREDRCEEASRLLEGIAQNEPVAVRPPRTPSVRDLLAKHGLSGRIKPGTEEVDRLTGKRLGPE